MDNIYNGINNLYNKKGFLERYGVESLISFLIIIVFVGIVMYFYIRNNIEQIKGDWVNKRCNPAYMPFAGMINAPEGANKFQYASENFNGCVNSILKTIMDNIMEPYYYTLRVANAMWNVFYQAIDSLRELINRIRTTIGSVTEDIMGRAINLMMPIIALLINIKDMIFKMHGITMATIYTALGSYLSLKSFLGNILNFSIKVLIALAVLVVLMWILPFTWGIAAAGTAIFVSAASILLMVIILMSQVFKIKGFKLPKVPRCFDENTKIKMWDNTEKTISNINLNDKLWDGSRVTATMKSSTEDHTFYNLNNVIATGTHNVHHDTLGLIMVKDHPDSILIPDYNKKFMYCLGTSSKVILINDVIFADWDEIDSQDIDDLKKNASHVIDNIAFKLSDIHKHLDGGLIETTKLELQNGDKKIIKNIKIGDTLKHGERVMGIVKIDATKLSGVYEYLIGDVSICGGPSLCMLNPNDSKNLGMIDTTKIKGIKLEESIDYEKTLYHLITDTRSFYINEIKVCDYNSCIDKYLSRYQKDLYLSLWG